MESNLLPRVLHTHPILQKQAAHRPRASFRCTLFISLSASEILAAVIVAGFRSRLKWYLIIDVRIWLQSNVGNAKSAKEEWNKQNFHNQPINLHYEQVCNYKKAFSQSKVIWKQGQSVIYSSCWTFCFYLYVMRKLKTKAEMEEEEWKQKGLGGRLIWRSGRWALPSWLMKSRGGGSWVGDQRGV